MSLSPHSAETLICQLPLAFPPITGVAIVYAPEGGVAFRLVVDEKRNERTSTTGYIPVTEKQLEIVMKLVEWHRQAFSIQQTGESAAR